MPTPVPPFFCARRLRLRRAVQLRQGGSVKRKRRRMSPDYSPSTQTAHWQAQRTAILFNENYGGNPPKTRPPRPDSRRGRGGGPTPRPPRGVERPGSGGG